MNQAAVKEHGGNQPVPLMSIENGVGAAHAQPVACLAAHAPQNSHAARFTMSRESQEADAEHENIRDEQGSCNWSFMVPYETRKFFAYGSQGKIKVCAALVTARSFNTHEGAAGGAKLGTGLIVFA